MRRGLRRFGPVLQMVEDLSDDDGVFDTGNHFNRSTALFTGFDIDGEYAFEALGPGHGGMALVGCCVFVGRSFTAPGRCDL